MQSSVSPIKKWSFRFLIKSTSSLRKKVWVSNEKTGCLFSITNWVSEEITRFETVSSIKLHYYLDSYENYSLFFRKLRL